MPCVCLNDADASKPGLCANQHEHAATRLVCAVAVGVASCLFVTGCASSRGGKSSGQAAVPMTVLGDSIDPLRQQFNADKDKLRVLALFSPT